MKSLDMPLQFRMAECIDRQCDRLADLHAIKLRFLEIGHDPFDGRHERNKLCACGDILAKPHTDFAKLAILEQEFVFWRSILASATAASALCRSALSPSRATMMVRKSSFATASAASA